MFITRVVRTTRHVSSEQKGATNGYEWYFSMRKTGYESNLGFPGRVSFTGGYG